MNKKILEATLLFILVLHVFRSQFIINQWLMILVVVPLLLFILLSISLPLFKKIPTWVRPLCFWVIVVSLLTLAFFVLLSVFFENPFVLSTFIELVNQGNDCVFANVVSNQDDFAGIGPTGGYGLGIGPYHGCPPRYHRRSKTQYLDRLWVYLSSFILSLNT